MTKKPTPTSRPRRSPSRLPATQRPPDAVARQAFEHLARVFSPAVVNEIRTRTGYNPRQRKATAQRLLLVAVEAFLFGQSLAFSSLRAFFVRRFGSIRPRAFQLRFKCKKAAAFFQEALCALIDATLSRVRLRLDGPLAAFDDVLLFDGTGQRVPKRGRAEMPGCTEGMAGAKAVIGYSLKTGLLEGASIGAETQSELPLWRAGFDGLKANILYVFDLAFFDRKLFAEALDKGAHLLLRLKSNVKPRVVGHVTWRGFVPLPGWTLGYYLQGASRQRGTVYDLDVAWGHGRQKLDLRLVGISQGASKGIRWYLTTVPRDILTAEQVIAAYRLRWLIELLFRELKQSADIGRSATADPHALAALTYAAMIGHVLVRSLRILAAIDQDVPLEQLRPLASLAIVRAFGPDIVDALACGGRTAWHRVIAPLLGALVVFAQEKKPSSSRPRIALQLGACGA